MPATTWKPTCASAWDGLYCASCWDAQTAAVTLVDSGVTHCIVSEAFLAKFEIQVKPGVDMDVTLADGS